MPVQHVAIRWKGTPTGSQLERAEGRQTFFTEAPKFLAVQRGEGGQFCLAELGEHEPLAAVIRYVGDPAHQPARLGPVDELDGGVVAKLHPVGDVADRGGLVSVRAA